MSFTSTLGYFLSELLHKRKMTNRTLAQGAGVSDSVISNLMQHGLKEKAKDPDPRTLRAVADFLEIDPLILFRLANYLPPAHYYSPSAEYLAGVFDRMPPEKQEAVWGVVEALAEDEEDQSRIRTIRENKGKLELAGVDEAIPQLLRMTANLLLTKGETADPNYIPNIDPEMTILPGNTFGDLSEKTQQRIIALMRAKLGLDYDPTMVDEEWRD